MVALCAANIPSPSKSIPKETKMRYARWMTTVLFAALVVAAPAAAADEVTYIPNDKVQVAVSKGGPLTDGSNYKVSISRRDKGGQAEVHDTETDIFYIMEGAATLVTGGTLIDSKTTSPGQVRGSGISGGETHMLSKGDVIVIPKGTAHWFKDVPKLVVYHVVKVL
jgi:glc operon protein GlcG